MPAGYYYDYLAQRDHLKLVEELASRFRGEPLRVAVKAAAAAAAAPLTQPTSRRGHSARPT